MDLFGSNAQRCEVQIKSAGFYQEVLMLGQIVKFSD